MYLKNKITTVYPPLKYKKEPFINLTRYKFYTIIDDVIIKLVNTFEEAEEFINTRTNDKAVLFYYDDNLTPDEHQELQMKTYTIQLYSIINGFCESNFQSIAENLFSIYSLVYATTILSNFIKLNNEQLKLAKSVLSQISKLLTKESYINPFILMRCEILLKQMINDK